MHKESEHVVSKIKLFKNILPILVEEISIIWFDGLKKNWSRKGNNEETNIYQVFFSWGDKIILKIYLKA